MLRLEKLLKDAGIDAYVNLSDPMIKTFTKPGQYIAHNFKMMQDRDTLIVVKSSSSRSEGQLMEIGAALYSGKRIVTLIKSGLEKDTYVHDSDISDESIFWDDEEDLLRKVKEVLL
jgi:hypothetical protein